MKAPKDKLAASAKVGEKGQIVIPKEMREMFSIKRGIAIPPKGVFNTFIEKVHGLMEGGERDG